MSAASVETAPRSYSRLSISMHWVTLALLVAVYAVILLRHEFPRGSEVREALKAWHFSLGLTVLGLVALRVIARLLTPRSPRRRGFGDQFAGAMHLALYGFMIVMPLLGWTILSAEGDPVQLFGLSMPPLAGQDKGLAERAEAMHETLGVIGYGLVGLHAAAALFHHYLLRDGTLRRMIDW